MRETTPSITIFQASRRRLMSIAYRMLGSVSEAEDVVQEAWLRWQETSRQELRAPVAWLTTVVTRLSIDRLRRLQRERDEAQSAWLPDPLVEEHAPSPEDTVSMLSDLSYGVLLLLERLNPEERAALLLYEVFDCPYDEIARTLNRKTEHCRQIVHRARNRIQSGRKRRVADEALCEKLVHDFLSAIRDQDKQAMMQLVGVDAVVVGDRSYGSPNACVAGMSPVSRFIDAVSSGALRHVEFHPAAVNGGWGAVAVWRGKIVLCLSVEIVEASISRIYVVADQNRLRSIPASVLLRLPASREMRPHARADVPISSR